MIDSPLPQKPEEKNLALRTVAVYEASKGALVLLVGMGLLAFVHEDLETWGEKVVYHLRLDPAHRMPRIFIHALAAASNQNLTFLAIGASVYALGRFIEAYGLWHGRAWAEWFAIITGGMYIPLEIYELFKHATLWKAGIFVINLAIVIYMCWLRYVNRKRRSAAASAAIIT